MADPLFDDFLDSDDAFDRCVRYWEQLVGDVERSVGQTGEWQPWISRYYADGKTRIDRDLQEIFTARSKRLDRGFRIHQFPSVAGDAAEIGARLESFGDEWDHDYVPAIALTVNLVLTEESAQLARSLLSKWMTATTSPGEMRSYILDLLGETWS